MRIASPQDVHYLALEGGGGKGVTYLGAIRALERRKVLPIDITRPGHNQIKGVSGASAGAITALLLAMGVTAAQIEDLLSRPQTFTAFYERPEPGLYRSVDARNQPALRQEAPPGMAPLDFVRRRTAEIKGWGYLASGFALAVRAGVLGDPNDPLVKQLITHPDRYLYNLLFDRGLFPGFAPRRFLAGVISTFLSSRFLAYTGGVISRSPNGGNVNFKLFHELTGVDLVITGANVTQHRPAVFSRRHTPEFPVAEAVGISMNIPGLFKPVFVEADVPVGALNRTAKDYHGFWVDGGLLNNFPLHAFDHLGPAASPRHSHLQPLHPNMLGLRLTDTPKPAQDSTGDFSVLLEYLGNLYPTVLYPSEQGQIRTVEEEQQTIDLLTYDLGLTEFAAPPAKRERPVREAEAAVDRYFG
jgi:predicted acylesterase/phospholipase RssA